MTTSNLATDRPLAINVTVTANCLSVHLQDGRVLSVPLEWYPRLAEGTARERRKWQLIGPGIGIHWPSLDEDISVEALLKGLGSNEAASSLERWRASRPNAVKKARQQTSRAPKKAKPKLRSGVASR